MLKLDNRLVKDFPQNQWLEGVITGVKEAGRHRRYAQFTIKWNGLPIFYNCFLRKQFKFLADLLEIKDFIIDDNSVDIDYLNEKFVNKVLGFKVIKESYQGRFFNKIVDFTSYAEQGYYQCLYRIEI